MWMWTFFITFAIIPTKAAQIDPKKHMQIANIYDSVEIGSLSEF